MITIGTPRLVAVLAAMFLAGVYAGAMLACAAMENGWGGFR